MSSFDLRTFQGLGSDWRVDVAEKKAAHLIIGKNGSRIRLSSSAFVLLQAVAAGLSLEELATRLQADGKTVSREKLEEIYDDLVKKLEKAEEDAASRRLPWGFWFRFRLMPAELVVRISAGLSLLYDPLCATVLLSLTVLAVLLTSALPGGFRLGLDEKALLPGYLLFLGVLVVHELGHAAACVRHGAAPSEIGFAVYLIYPALYSDVNSSWQLKRWQRVMVDIGGTYFQFLVSGALMLLFYQTRWEPLRFAVTMSLYAAILSLNPIFKFDGYWLLADLLGVTSLGKQPVRIAKYCFDRLQGRATKPLPWSSVTTSILCIYSLLSVSIWCYFLWRLIPSIYDQLGTSLEQAATIWIEAQSGTPPKIDEWQSLLMSMFYLVISVVMMWQVGKMLLKSLAQRVEAFIAKWRDHNSEDLRRETDASPDPREIKLLGRGE